MKGYLLIRHPMPYKYVWWKSKRHPGYCTDPCSIARKEVLTTESRSRPTQVRERLLVPVQRDPALILSWKPPSRLNEPSNLKVYVNKLRFEWESRTPVTVIIDLSKRLTRKQRTVQRTEGENHHIPLSFFPAGLVRMLNMAHVLHFFYYLLSFYYRGHAAQVLFVLEVICRGLSLFGSQRGKRGWNSSRRA